MTHNYKLIPNMTKLDNFDTLNTVLSLYGAKISTNSKCLQPKDKGYIGYFFKESKKPVYDFDIVSVNDGKSFANVYSDIYRKLPSDVMDQVRNCFIETTKAIYC